MLQEARFHRSWLRPLTGLGALALGLFFLSFNLFLFTPFGKAGAVTAATEVSGSTAMLALSAPTDATWDFTLSFLSLDSRDSEAVSAGDVDGDGDLDVVVGNWVKLTSYTGIKGTALFLLKI